MKNFSNRLRIKISESLYKRKSDIQIYLLKNMDEYLSISQVIGKKWDEYEAELTSKTIESGIQGCAIEGYCTICNTKVNFILDMLYSDGKIPNYRERLVCPICGLNNRQRFILSRTLISLNKASKVYMYEQITPFYKKAKTIIPNIVGSEYLGDNLQSGTIINDIRHEDGCNLSFPDNTFDVIISNDVYEHVNNIEACLSEAARVLKAGGKLIMSIPFYVFNSTTQRRAIIKEGRVEYLKEPQYHGNPLSDDGSLVFYDFGWDIIDMLKRAGFKHSYMTFYYSKDFGHIGKNLFIFESTK